MDLENPPRGIRDATARDAVRIDAKFDLKGVGAAVDFCEGEQKMPSNISKSAATAQAMALLEALIDRSISERVGFRFWDGTPWPDERVRPATLVLRHPDALENMLLPGTEAGLAEAYLRDDFDLEGNVETAFDLAEHLLSKNGSSGGPARWLGAWRNLPAGAKLRAAGRLLPHGLGRQHSRERDRQAVTFHYNVSNEFYALWLDRNMIYSCGYFESPEDTLETAQQRKLDYLCRKLRLHPGQRLLDIGCGWGALVRHAAEYWGVRATGITLSEPQAAWARTRVTEAGLAGRVNVELMDYRDCARTGESYDAIVSVGMAEHVGREHLPEYFRIVWNALKPRGVFLNHAIAEGPVPRLDAGGEYFIDRHVFPDSDVPPISVVAAAAQSAGFEVRDIESLREHYALTLRHWLRRLEAAHDDARRFVDESTYRTWRLYLAGSAHGFAVGHLDIFQTLLCRLDEHGAAGLPLTRADWYQPPRPRPDRI